MNKYNVLVSFTTYGNMEILANSEEEARNIANQLDGENFITDDNAGSFEIVNVTPEPEEVVKEFEVTVQLKLSSKQNHSLQSIDNAVREVVGNAFNNDINYEMNIEDMEVILFSDDVKVYELIADLGQFNAGDLIYKGDTTHLGTEYFNMSMEMKGDGSWSRYDIPKKFLYPATDGATAIVLNYLKSKL